VSRALPFTQAAISRAVAGVQKAGLRVKGVLVRPGGTIVVQSGDEPADDLSRPEFAIQTGPSSSKWED
jgi:hypothetical protein